MALEQKTCYKNLILTVVIIMAFWLFGQIYEAIVYSPNWIVSPIEQIRHLNSFYAVTSARNYFEPIVPLGVLVLWILYFVCRDTAIKKMLLPAFVFSVLAMAVNIYIVVALLLIYLNEFVYKLNRRYFGEKLFDRLILACITYK